LLLLLLLKLLQLLGQELLRVLQGLVPVRQLQLLELLWL
jgi:hypothetical protein